MIFVHDKSGWIKAKTTVYETPYPGKHMRTTKWAGYFEGFDYKMFVCFFRSVTIVDERIRRDESAELERSQAICDVIDFGFLMDKAESSDACKKE